jgi:hypothetical protein
MFLQARKLLIDISLQLKEFDYALTESKEILDIYRLVLPENHPMFSIILFYIAKLTAFSALGLTEATSTIKNAIQSLEVTHGERHPFYLEACTLHRNIALELEAESYNGVR